MTQSRPPVPEAKRWDHDIFPVLRRSLTLWIVLQFLVIVSVTAPIIRFGEPHYYRMMPAIIITLIFMYLLVPWVRNTLKSWYTPAFIFILVVVPTGLAYSIDFFEQPGSNFYTFVTTSRGLPLLFGALVFTAWYYGFRGAFIFTIATTLMDVALRFVFGLTLEFTNFEFFVQMDLRAGSFIVIGFLISQIVKHVRNQAGQLMEANSQLVHYNDALEELSVNQERSRMARELHDTLAHSLTALTVQLEATKALMEKDKEKAGDSLQKALDTAREGLKETRYALKSLRSGRLESMGLINGLAKLAEETPDDIEVILKLPEALEHLDSRHEHSLYRIAQEAIHNTVKHANANKIHVSLMQSLGKTLLTIEDNGQGFNPDTSQSGFGLLGMNERASLSGGELTILSQPGNGTRVQVEI